MLRAHWCALCLSSLNYDGRGAATAVADASGAEPRAVLLEHREQGHDDARAAAADRVADGDGASVDVDLGGVEAEQLVVGERDD